MKRSAKNVFRRVSAVVIASVMLVVCTMLGGCGDDFSVKAYTFTDEIGGNYRIEYTHDGDVITKQHQVYTLDFSEIDEAIEQVLKSKAESMSNAYEELDYVEYDYSFKDDIFTEKVTIKDISDNIGDISEKKLMPIEAAEDAEHISLEEVEKTLLDSGWQHAE